MRLPYPQGNVLHWTVLKHEWHEFGWKCQDNVREIRPFVLFVIPNPQIGT
jgi:hypothetical protein